MATTDSRSGFRLPWGGDRTQEDPAGSAAGDEAPASDPVPAKADIVWPESDFASRAGFTAAAQRPADAPEEPLATEEAPTMTEQPAPPPKKVSKLMADLAAAIRATTEAARDQRLSQVETEATGIVGQIRALSEEGANALRRRSDEDVAGIRDWAKAEIARIKEESEARIGDRKHLLEREIADHAAAIEDRVAEVNSTVAGYRSAMDAYFGRLEAEEDPARLATMAEAMPEPPSLEGMAEIDEVAIAAAAATQTGEDAEGAAETVAQSDADAAGASLTGESFADFAAAVAAHGGPDGEPAEDDVPRWAAGETPEGFPEPVEGGDPVDRGAIMAALEAAAEAVVAAEAAAESAETAEAAADVAETAAEILAGRAGQQDEPDPEAQAAMAARVDAGGFDTESYQDRLASLMPGHADGAADGEPRTTQVVVNGLVSVASIASFKRHLGRIAGVTAVAVASGPEGEFIFNVSHRADVSFRDAIPTMPGFAARVTAAGDGAISVTAHDPEAEG